MIALAHSSESTRSHTKVSMPPGPFPRLLATSRMHFPASCKLLHSRVSSASFRTLPKDPITSPSPGRFVLSEVHLCFIWVLITQKSQKMPNRTNKAKCCCNYSKKILEHAQPQKRNHWKTWRRPLAAVIRPADKNIHQIDSRKTVIVNYNASQLSARKQLCLAREFVLSVTLSRHKCRTALSNILLDFCKPSTVLWTLGLAVCHFHRGSSNFLLMSVVCDKSFQRRMYTKGF